MQSLAALPAARLLQIFIAITMAAWLGGCGGSSASVSGAAGDFDEDVEAAVVDLLVKDAPIDGLLALRVTFTSARLVRDDGVLCDELLEGSVRLDLAGLWRRAAWLRRVGVERGVYPAISLRIDGSSVSATSRDGSPVEVEVLDEEFLVEFERALYVVEAPYHQLVVDVDLQGSLRRDEPGAPLEFRPEAVGVVDRGGSERPLWDFKGLAFPLQNGLQVAPFADHDLVVPVVHRALVDLEEAVLIAADGTALRDVRAFLDSLNGDKTVLEVHSSVDTGGILRARQVEISDPSRGRLSADQVEIEGLVDQVEERVAFDLLLADVRKSEELAREVLDALGDPATLRVRLDPETVIYRESGRLGTTTDLAVAQRVMVRFPDFAGDPGRASRVSIQDELPELEAVVTDTARTPAQITVHGLPTEPLVRSGEIASADTDVTVELRSGELVLDVPGEPLLDTSQLEAGQQIEIRGTWSGTPEVPTVMLGVARVHPGLLQGFLRTTDGARPSIGVEVDRILQPFGVELSGPELEVVFLAETRFGGEADSLSSFWDRYHRLGPDERLWLEVRGVATGQDDEVYGMRVDCKGVPISRP